MTGSRYRDIASPARTDGVGIALRRAFDAAPTEADDFTSLLQELDRKTRL